ncbi:MAG: hypothetical protein IJ693_06740 [Bacteroidaceae bacterium]|nr:hypothetical protein [Bacteroidaceae bacterium]
MKTNNIDIADDALYKVMRRMKARREVPRLSDDFEDRVMAQIEAIAPSRKEIKPAEKRSKVVRMWMLRAISAAAVITGIFLLAEKMMPEKEEGQSKVVAKVETSKPVEPRTEAKEENPQTEKVTAPPAQRPNVPTATKHSNTRHSAVVNIAEEKNFATSDNDVCIDCEMEVMANELTAMMNEFENL